MCEYGQASAPTAKRYVRRQEEMNEMIKREASSGILILFAWGTIDYLLHGLVLKPTYEASAHLWRSQSEMNLPLIYLVVVILIVCFVAIYSRFITPKSMAKGIVYGTIYGLATGIAVGFGTYIHMPVPSTLAWGWFLGGWAKGIVAGAIVGAIVRPRRVAQGTPDKAL
jgi:hypothetical protein